MEYLDKLQDDLFHLARVALGGQQQDVHLLVRKIARRYRTSDSKLAEQLTTLLRNSPTRASPTRRVDPSTLPVDGDSRLPLMRLVESPVLEVEPVYDERTWQALRQVVAERQRSDRLVAAGIDPTRSVLFTGPPGVGKTLGAKWIARELGQQLATLDLSAVMSSFLGRTGNNVRTVLDYAKEHDCILLLDELDAVAKRRDDSTEIGELKRLVTVLLQEVDDWPSTSLLVAATNHPHLLDRAVWRRFEMVVDFPLPGSAELTTLITDLLDLPAGSAWPSVLGQTLNGCSFSDAVLRLRNARRSAALKDENLETGLEFVVRDAAGNLTQTRRQQLAVALCSQGLASQRQASELTGISRDTIRKHSQNGVEE